MTGTRIAWQALMRLRTWLVSLVGVGLLAAWVWRGGLWLAAWPYRHAGPLEVPVAGMARASVVSQWGALRSGGRRHQGVDLFAPRGTQVQSATRGRVWRVGWDSLGGRVVWVLGEGPALYYYAHLDSWAEGLRPGDLLLPGVPLGKVGTSGNAAHTPPHLHFGVYRVGLFKTEAVDPAPLLRGSTPPTR